VGQQFDRTDSGRQNSKSQRYEMKQVIQNRKSGKVTVGEVPIPAVQSGRVLVRTVASLISAGTEKAAVENAKKSLVQEARERPELVKKVIDRARSEGVRSTFSAVLGKLSASQALGYSAAGLVIAVGADVTEFAPGDRVACAGVGFASHAEVLSVPKNLCAKLPEEVSYEAGAFGTLGAIALQGVRLAAPTIGESVVVIGLGLVGQLTVQLLKANGCRVFGVDLDDRRVELARRLGADAVAVSSEETKLAVLSWSSGRGADAVLITAATDSNQPIELAGEISRIKGRVVVVGMTGLTVPRASYFSRELSLQISMSYGPGRYDPEYEERGNDYPFGYVRWTEQRNLEAFLTLVAGQRIKVEPLITHRFEIDDAERAYDLLSGNTSEPYLGVLLRYDPERAIDSTVQLQDRSGVQREKTVRLGVIGAGGYLTNVLLPEFKNAGADFVSVATASGLTAIDAGKKFGFKQAVSDAAEILNDANINLVVIGTRHDSHAQLAIAALQQNKHVFVEKPLALNDDELDRVLAAAANSSGKLMVGFNRRFSPLTQKAKIFFSSRQSPLSILYRVNAGRIPREHWIQDAQQGGRIIGEVCHFVDLMQFLIDSPLESVFAEAIGATNHAVINHDSVFITLRFADGSTGSIAYLAEGDKSLAKERIEVFGDGKSFVIDDFRSATSHSNGREDKTSLRGQDKGQSDEVKAVCAVVLEGREVPIPLSQLSSTTRATFRILDSIRTGKKIMMSDEQ
jgi:predicted dehydrogenase/threonine dehydrogenase-like Zn-dependent dehydrogenase